MKAYLLAHWNLLVTGFMLVLFLSVTGCTFLKTQPDTARLAVVFATAKFIEKSPDPVVRAGHVADIVSQVSAVLDGNPETTVALLRTAALDALPASLTPIDRVFATELINVIAAELTRRVADSIVPGDRTLAIKKVLAWVLEGTTYFTPPDIEVRQ